MNLYKYICGIFAYKTLTAIVAVMMVSDVMATDPLNVSMEIVVGAAAGIEAGRTVVVNAPIELKGGWIYGYQPDEDLAGLPWNFRTPEGGDPQSTLSLQKVPSIIAHLLIQPDYTNGTVLQPVWTLNPDTCGGINRNVILEPKEDIESKLDITCAITSAFEDHAESAPVDPIPFNFANSSHTVNLCFPDARKDNQLFDYGIEFRITEAGGAIVGGEGTLSDKALNAACNFTSNFTSEGGDTAIPVTTKFTGNYNTLNLSGDWSGYKGGPFTTAATDTDGGTVFIKNDNSFPQSNIVVGSNTTLQLANEKAMSNYMVPERLIVKSGGTIAADKNATTLSSNGSAMIISSGGTIKVDGELTLAGATDELSYATFIEAGGSITGAGKLLLKGGSRLLFGSLPESGKEKEEAE
ncbi:hypothetical protein FACS1894122_11630 [Alphaproteobacteria bacterium]|nr:hypothetical protein FACS1894122_11630 [Alphaproteobacteria bacterium]